MLYKQDYFGFVYIWRDRKHGRFYIGSHMGSANDGYICSSTWMRNAHDRRPQDFKRRIIYWHKEERRSTLLLEERRWLNMVSDGEIKTRYYNRTRQCFGEETKERTPRKPMTDDHKKAIARGVKNFLDSSRSVEYKRHRRTLPSSMKGRKHTPEALAKFRERRPSMLGKRHRADTIEKIRLAAKAQAARARAASAT